MRYVRTLVCCLLLSLAAGAQRMTVLGQTGPLAKPQGPFTSAIPLILTDSAGINWAVTLDDNGYLHTAVTTQGTSVSSYVLDAWSDGAGWRLGITTSGYLTIVSSTPQTSLPSQLWFFTPSHASQLWVKGVAFYSLTY